MPVGKWKRRKGKRVFFWSVLLLFWRSVSICCFTCRDSRLWRVLISEAYQSISISLGRRSHVLNSTSRTSSDAQAKHLNKKYNCECANNEISSSIWLRWRMPTSECVLFLNRSIKHYTQCIYAHIYNQFLGCIMFSTFCMSIIKTTTGQGKQTMIAQQVYIFSERTDFISSEWEKWNRFMDIEYIVKNHRQFSHIIFCCKILLALTHFYQSGTIND